MPSFCDYDRDGDLDVFILTNRNYRAGGRPKTPPFEKTADGRYVVKAEFAKYYALTRKGPNSYDMDEVGQPDMLLRNDGGKFTDVSAAVGIAKVGHGLSTTWWDFDNDGFLDIYIANDFTDPDNLFRNNGDGKQDYVAGINHGALVAFINASSKPAARSLSLSLVGRKGNPSAAGSTVTFLGKGGEKLGSTEIYQRLCFPFVSRTHCNNTLILHGMGTCGAPDFAP